MYGTGDLFLWSLYYDALIQIQLVTQQTPQPLGDFWRGAWTRSKILGFSRSNDYPSLEIPAGIQSTLLRQLVSQSLRLHSRRPHSSQVTFIFSLPPSLRIIPSGSQIIFYTTE